MNKCQKCGTEFEGKFCPECGTPYATKWRCLSCNSLITVGAKFCPECGVKLGTPVRPDAPAPAPMSAPAQPQRSMPVTLYHALLWAPAVLLTLLSVLLFAFFAAPVIKANGMLIAGSESLYEVLGDASLDGLHATMYACIAFACLGVIAGAGALFAKWKGKEGTASLVIACLVYAVIFILGCVTVGKVNALDKDFTNGAGMFTAGACGILLIIFPILFALFTILSQIFKNKLWQSHNKAINAQKTIAAQRAQSKKTAKPNWFKKHIKLVVPLAMLTVVAVVLLSLIPTFRLASVNGTYYASYSGTVDRKVFVTLKTGKWTDSSGGSGTYKVDGKMVTLYSTDPVTGLQFTQNGAVSNGVLTVGETNNYRRYVKENHKHKYGEWEVVRSSTCTLKGEIARPCLCGHAETKETDAWGHSYGTWETTLEPTCVEMGTEEHKCAVCGNIENRSIAALGHTYDSWETTLEPTCVDEGTEHARCIVCENEENRSIAALGHLRFVNGKCSACDYAQLQYTLINDYYVVAGFNVGVEEKGDVVILSKYNNLPVKSIWLSAFFNCSGLTSVTIPNSVTSIGNGAFEGCSGLTSVTIPNGVTNIKYSAFYGCSGLTSITIPNSVTSIENSAFYGCRGLTSITIPNSVTSIGDSAFFNCSGLTSVTIPNSVTSIGDSAFYGCRGVISVTIGNGVTSIGGSAFENCSELTSIAVAPENPAYHSAGNCLIDTANKALILGCKTSVIPTNGSVTSIGNGAFYGCSGLTSITIPNSVKRIGKEAFKYCGGLTRVKFENPDGWWLSNGLSSTSIPRTRLFDPQDAAKSLTEYYVGSTIERK